MNSGFGFTRWKQRKEGWVHFRKDLVVNKRGAQSCEPQEHLGCGCLSSLLLVRLGEQPPAKGSQSRAGEERISNMRVRGCLTVLAYTSSEFVTGRVSGLFFFRPQSPSQVTRSQTRETQVRPNRCCLCPLQRSSPCCPRLPPHAPHFCKTSKQPRWPTGRLSRCRKRLSQPTAGCHGAESV